MMDRHHIRLTLIATTINLLIQFSAAQFDYCSITPKHTMCSKEGYGSTCKEPIGHGVSGAERSEIIRVHNELRAKLANGQESFGKPGPQPPAADMEVITWDEELARVAQRHADQCQFAHDCADCRKIPRFNVGQNLYTYKQSIREAPTNWTTAVSDWYYEVKLFDKAWVKPFKFGLDIGHFTAMVWSNTNKVGCGMTAYKEGKWFTKLYTCNYGPAGNYIGGQMYEQGRACSKCPSGTGCSKEFPGLCGSGGSFISTFNEVDEDIFESPIPEVLPVEVAAPVINVTASRFVPPFSTTTRRPRPQTAAATTPRPTTTRTTTTRSTTTTTTTTTPEPTTSTTTTTTTPRPTTAARTTTTRRTTTPRTTTTRRTTTRPTTTTATTTPFVPSTTATFGLRNEFTLTKTTRPSKFSAPISTEVEPINAVEEVFNDEFDLPEVDQMFNCNFDQNAKFCPVKFSGKSWTLTSEPFDPENFYYELTMNTDRDQSELFFSDMIPQPDRGVACIGFRYKKFQSGGVPDVPLQVVVWPFHGRPGIVKINRNSPDSTTWIRAQLTFRKISSSFILLFRADSVRSGQMYLAVDDVEVTEGKC